MQKYFIGETSNNIENKPPASSGDNVKTDCMKCFLKFAIASIISSNDLVKTATVPPLKPGIKTPKPIRLPFKKSTKIFLIKIIQYHFFHLEKYYGKVLTNE